MKDLISQLHAEGIKPSLDLGDDEDDEDEDDDGEGEGEDEWGDEDSDVEMG